MARREVGSGIGRAQRRVVSKWSESASSVVRESVVGSVDCASVVRRSVVGSVDCERREVRRGITKKILRAKTRNV